MFHNEYLRLKLQATDMRDGNGRLLLRTNRCETA